MNRLDLSIEAINGALPIQPEEWQVIVAAKCRGLMAGYDARWRNVEYEVDAVEVMVESDLWNPESQRKSRSFRVAGKLDVRAKYQGRSVIIDHKTSSMDISDPNAPYWRQLVVEGQASHYMLLEWLNGRKAESAMWDVTRKPSISPKNVLKSDAKATIITKQYCGRRMSDGALDYLAATGREDIEMYEARLAHDCTEERPNWYFRRRTVPRLDAEIAEYAGDLWEHGQEILHVRNTDRHARNSGACMQYGSPCKFLGICSGYDEPDSANWRPKATVHPELPMLAGDGKDVLTNSRIRKFQTCRKLHYFEYELGIERHDAEEREALWFGTLFHEGLRVWWECWMTESAKQEMELSHA